MNQEDVDWSDVIIILRKRLEGVLKKKFKAWKTKKLIVLDVTDSKRLIPEKYAHLRNLDGCEFQKKWTYLQLRKAIKPYLHLKISKE